MKKTPSNLLSRSVHRLCTAMLLCLTAASHADSITLVNGDRLSGTITSIAGGAVMIEGDIFGAIAVPMDQVTTIDKAEPVTVVTTTGNEYAGVLTMDGGRQVIATDRGPQTIGLAELTSATNIAPPPPTWVTTADVGFIRTKGNSNNESRSLHLDTLADRGAIQHRGFAYWHDDEAEEEVTRDTFDAGYNIRYYFRDKWYAFGNLGYFQDKLKDIDRRITVGAGLGYTFFDDNVARWSTDLGITMVLEDLGGETENNPAVRWGMDYFRWLQPDKIEYFYGHEVLKILDSARGEIYKANTGLRLHLSERWHANARIDLVHETEPPIGSHKSDITYSFGFGMTL